MKLFAKQTKPGTKDSILYDTISLQKPHSRWKGLEVG